MPSIAELAPRAYNGCPSGYHRSGSYCYRNSSWYWWGRWVLAGIVIFFFLLVLISCMCLSRRRRRRGVKPIYGTGWMAPGGKFNAPPPQNNHQMYNYGGQQNGYNQNPPPAYGGQQQPVYGGQQQQQYTGTTFNPNDGYYGNQHSGVQPPTGTYQRDDVYSPPVGPPPGK